jgi:hypothetical protein
MVVGVLEEFSVMFRGSLHLHLTQRKLLGKGDHIVNRLNDFPHSSFVIIAKGKVSYLLVLYARV